MPELFAIELLNAWEKGQGHPTVFQALLLLAAAYREKTREDLSRLPIGQRDGLLLSLRQQLFGQELEVVTNCPSCNEPLEFDFRISDIADSGTAEIISDEHVFNSENYQVLFRLPNSVDIMEVAALDEAEARQALLHRCISQVLQHGSEIDSFKLPQEAVEMLNRHMADLDPQADIEIDLSCPECEHRWSDLFDIVTYLWEEIDRWAHRTLEEVHVLAAAYGWSQNDILNLSAWRRQAYIELIGNR